MRVVIIAAVLASLFAVAPASAQVTRIYPDKIYIEQPAASVSRHVRKRSVRHVRKRGVRHAVRQPTKVVRQRTTVVRPVRGRSGTLPATSGVEVRTNEINRSLTNQGQALQQQQQNQFEINQLRQGIERPSVTGPPTIGSPTGGRICPPGATGC